MEAINKITSIFAAIPNKLKVNILIGFIVLLIIWFVLPLIKMSGVYPFATVTARLVVAGTFLGLYLVILLIDFCIKNKEKTINVMIAKSVAKYASIKTYIKQKTIKTYSNIKAIKHNVSEDRKQRRLSKLPWYLVLGNPSAGKKHVIKNTGMYFARPEHFCEEAVNYVNQFPDFDCWFSEQAIMLDVMTYEKDKDKSNWQRFIKLLKKQRKNKPINGIILNFSLPELMLYSNKNRQEFLQDVCQYIRDIHANFKSMVPVYIIFNKCDLVEGFLAFFNDLSKEELRQVWGMTLPIEQCHQLQFVIQFFNYEYNNLIAHLNNRVMWALDSERTARGRELIYQFPQQMHLLKKPIESFISELFGATRYPKALQLRGVYFTSCDQNQGEAYDFVLQAMSKKFQLIPPRFQKQTKLSECYFMRNIFFDIIYPEAAILGDSERNKRNKKMLYNLSLASCPIILLLIIIGMHEAYNENINNIKLINNKLNYYEKTVANINVENDAIQTILPALDELYQSTQTYNQATQKWLNFIFASHYIKYRLNNTMERALHELFLPRIAANLQDSLESNIQDPNLLYATLKGYLAFSNTSKVNSDAIKAPMQYQWQADYIDDNKKLQRLNTYLDLALANKIDKYPLDNTLINRIREELEQIIPSDRAYGLLIVKSSVSDIPALTLVSAVGANYKKIFKSKDGYPIAGLYTKTGYEQIYIPEYQAIAKAVAKDNKEIGLVNDSDTTQTARQITKIVQQTYNKHYINNWDHALNNTQVKSFDSLSQAIDNLTILTSKDSPLIKLLDITYDNTAQIKSNNVNVAKHYEAINDYTKLQQGEANLAATQKALTNLKNYLQKLQQSANKNQACFDAAVAAMNGTQNPIQTLSEIANKSPSPIKTWLNSIADNAWDVIIKGAHAQMNAAWQVDVMNDYDVSISDRYPFSKKADSEVSIEDFNNFFADKGTLDKYFKTYIRPFVNIEENNWSIYNVNHHSIELPDSTLQLFKRAALIKKNYFDPQTNKVTFAFSIKPLTLDAKASSASLTMGSEHILYQHGPQPTREVIWPMPFNQQDASIVINDFDGNQHAHSASGPWAIFKVLDDGAIKMAAHNGTYYYTINMGGYHATYLLTGNGNLATFRLADLNGYKLPKEIAPERG